VNDSIYFRFENGELRERERRKEELEEKKNR